MFSVTIICIIKKIKYMKHKYNQLIREIADSFTQSEYFKYFNP